MLSHRGLSFTDLSSVAYMVVLIGIAIAMGVWINRETGYTLTSTFTVTNESVNLAVNNTPYGMAWPYVKEITLVNNATFQNATHGDDDPITSTHYGLSEIEGTSYITLYSNATNPAGIKWVSYTAYNTTELGIVKNATQGVYNLAKWMPVIAVVIAASVVVGVVVTWLATRRQEEV